MNKNVLITGAAGLLGRQHAISLLEEDEAVVVLTDIDTTKLSKLVSTLREVYSDERIHYFKMDVTDKDEIVEVKEKLKSLDISIEVLINNAAINPHCGDDSSFTRFENFNVDIWNKECAVGLTGALLVTQVFLEDIKLTKGKIINISSDLSVIAPDQRLYMQKDTLDSDQPVKPVSYSVIKSGLVGLTKYLASYLAKDGVCVNALSPGGVFNNQPTEFLHKVEDRIPLGRMAQENEYHEAIRFLSSRNNKYFTGQNLVIDGGRSII